MATEKILRKHVAIIHAYSMMSVLQRKIVNVLFAEALHNQSPVKTQDSVFVECHMSFATLAKSIGFLSHNTQYLKESVDGLASLKMEWNLLKDKIPTNISFLNLRILQGSPTFYKDGQFYFSFHKVLLDLLGNPSVYGTIDLDLQAQFESKYSHSLYENSTRFLNLQKQKIISLETVRKLLGVEENAYESMAEFSRRVMKPAREEVNDRSNFVIDWEEVKSGRKILGFSVGVQPKKPSIVRDRDTRASSAISHALQSEIQQNFGSISQTVLNTVLKQYSEAYILEKIAYTKAHAKKDHSGFYPIPYLMKAIQEDYHRNENAPVSDAQRQSMQPSDARDPNSYWYQNWDALDADLKHWQRQFTYAKSAGDAVLMDQIQQTLSVCEANIQQHMRSKPQSDLQIDGML